jgi:hypothetical protein
MEQSALGCRVGLDKRPSLLLGTKSKLIVYLPGFSLFFLFFTYLTKQKHLQQSLFHILSLSIEEISRLGIIVM